MARLSQRQLCVERSSRMKRRVVRGEPDLPPASPGFCVDPEAMYSSGASGSVQTTRRYNPGDRRHTLQGVNVWTGFSWLRIVSNDGI